MEVNKEALESLEVNGEHFQHWLLLCLQTGFYKLKILKAILSIKGKFK